MSRSDKGSGVLPMLVLWGVAVLFGFLCLLRGKILKRRMPISWPSTRPRVGAPIVRFKGVGGEVPLAYLIQHI